MAAHGVIYQSPTRGGQPCGLQIISAFLRDPNAPLQDGCLTDLEPINFRGTPEYTEFLFETSDAWENDDGKPGTGASPPPGWDEIVRAYQRGRFAPAP